MPLESKFQSNLHRTENDKRVYSVASLNSLFDDQ